jgi:hypothetical protein
MLLPLLDQLLGQSGQLVVVGRGGVRAGELDGGLDGVGARLKEAGVGVILTTLRAALTIDSLGSKPVCRNLNSTIYELNTLGFGE